MRTRPKFLLFTGLLFSVLVGVVILVVMRSEPSYQGKKLTAWIDDLSKSNSWQQWDTNTAPAKAIRAIGTNAIPWLLRDIRHPVHPMEYRLNALLNKQHLVKYRFPDMNARLRRASLGFQALGTIAKPAIPDLEKLIEDYPGYVPGILASIGPDALPALQQCMTNTFTYQSSVGPLIPIPGNALGGIHNAINFGRIPKSNAELFLPAARAWAVSTNRNPAEYNYAADFLKDFDK